MNLSKFIDEMYTRVLVARAARQPEGGSGAKMQIAPRHFPSFLRNLSIIVRRFYFLARDQEPKELVVVEDNEGKPLIKLILSIKQDGQGERQVYARVIVKKTDRSALLHSMYTEKGEDNIWYLVIHSDSFTLRLAAEGRRHEIDLLKQDS
jgi:hypothetical protein